MIGTGEVLAFLFFVVALSYGPLFAMQHGRSSSLGLILGISAFVAVIAGIVIGATCLEFRERKKYPNRKGLGLIGNGILFAIFFASSAATVLLYRMMCS